MASHNHAWLRFFWVDVSWLFALTNGLERVKISKTAIENIVYGWPLTLWCLIITVRLQSGTKEYSILSIFSAIASREIGDDCFNLSGFYWVQTIIERDSCAITYYRGVEWRKMSGVKNIIFRCYILLFSTDGWGGLMYFSISLHILCEVPRSFSPNSYSVYGERPYVYCKRTWLWAQICLKDEKSNTLWYQTKYSSQVREDTLTKEDTLPKLKLKPNK